MLLYTAAMVQTESVYEELMPDEDDLLYEEELLRNPYSVKMWWRYLQARRGSAPKRRYLLFERALKALPGSYKVGQIGALGCACYICQDYQLICSDNN